MALIGGQIISQRRAGVAVEGDKVNDVLAAIERAEQLRIQAAWMTTGGARLDSLTTFAAAALRTHHIALGTSIVSTFPRHPLEVANNTWGDRTIDAVVLWGNKARVKERLRELFSFGATEVLVSPVAAGSKRTASLDRTMRLLGRTAQAIAAVLFFATLMIFADHVESLTPIATFLGE
jgi:luciferase-like monooxygenase